MKLNVGRYLQAAQNGLAYAALRPSGRLTTTVTRSWTDVDGDFVPDCDLALPTATRSLHMFHSVGHSPNLELPERLAGTLRRFVLGINAS